METIETLRAKLEAAEAEIDDYDKLTQLQHQAGIRATKLYNDKHGTHIGLMDFAKGEVFLMEEIDGLKVKLKMTADKLRVTEKARNGLNLYSHKLERQCDELKFKLEAAEIKIDELQTRNTVLFNTRQNIQAVLDMVRHELDETYIDENGTTWTRPTAWAYYAVCKARDMWHKQAIENQEEAIELQSQVATLTKENADLEQYYQETGSKQCSEYLEHVMGLAGQVEMFRGALADTRQAYLNVMQHHVQVDCNCDNCKTLKLIMKLNKPLLNIGERWGNDG